jgi:hypothetical protein
VYYKITLMKTILAVLFFAFLSISANAQNDTTSNWTIVGNQSLKIENGVFVFDKTAAGSDNRAFRKLPTTLSKFAWTLKFECNPTSLNNGVGACMYLALTANESDPQCLPFAQTGEQLAWTKNTVLRLTFDNEYQAGEANCGFNILYRKDKPMDWASRKWAYSAPVNQGIYYIKMERNSQSTLTLNVYNDAAYTHNVSGTPLSISLPAEINDFNYIQVGAYNEGITDRVMSGTISNIQLTTTIGLSPKSTPPKPRRKRKKNSGMQR